MWRWRRQRRRRGGPSIIRSHCFAVSRKSHFPLSLSAVKPSPSLSARLYFHLLYGPASTTWRKPSPTLIPFLLASLSANQRVLALVTNGIKGSRVASLESHFLKLGCSAGFMVRDTTRQTRLPRLIGRRVVRAIDQFHVSTRQRRSRRHSAFGA